MIRKHNLIFFALAAAFLFISCNNNYPHKPKEIVPVKSISLVPDERTISLVHGGSRQIEAHVLPKNATHKKFTYVSDNEEIVSVNDEGLITAKAVGSAKITIVAADGVSKEITVTVTTTYVPVRDISLGPNESPISLVNGGERQIEAHVLPKNASNKKITFSLDNQEIASITDEGKITAKKVGNAVITIKAADGISKTVNLTVTAAPVSVRSIVIEGTPPASLIIGESYRIMAKAKPDEATNKELTYTADNDKAYVAYDGTVTAQSKGTVNITVKSQSNPEITKTVTITIKHRPSIELIEKEVSSSSDETNPSFKVKTLNGKLDYTVEIVGEESSWLKFDKKESEASEVEDTIHLKAKLNKTVWSKTAYIKFKGVDNKYIEDSSGNELEVKFTQKENKNPIVTIKWVDGIDAPTPSEKTAIPVCQARKEDGELTTEKQFYWDDSEIFWWYESNTTKWFNNRKLLNLGVTADNNAADSNQCWAKTASNMLHWWFVQNKTYIDRYKQRKSQEEQEKYQDYYKRELYNENKSEEEKKEDKEKEREKSYIANIFRTKAHNNQLGDFTMSGLAWYLYGHSGVTLPKIKEKYPAFEGPALFKDVFSKENTPIKRETVDGQDSFNKIISNALKSKKSIGIDIWGSKGKKDYAHAITLWGAAFDEEENIIAIYVVDNNFASNRIFPYGIWYKDGKPYLFNYGVNQFVQNRYVGQVTTLDKGEELWQEWFRTH